ncbi:MAG: DUF2384 domain-containing protein [Rhodocyclaceae bacterium]|nr:DUF2384 domain-containing protein [Rhodocyclaceae bacterium]
MSQASGGTRLTHRKTTASADAPARAPRPRIRPSAPPEPESAHTADAWRNYLSEFLQSPAANQIDEIRAGIPASTLLGAAAAMDVPRERFYELVGLSISTAKRKLVRNELLDSAVSERLTAIGAIDRLAEQVFGAAGLASDWLQTPNAGLGQVTPLSMLDTEIGRREVARLLNAIAYGAAA